MITAHEKLTNEAGETFVLLPLEEYEQIQEQRWHREAMLKGRNEESFSITLEEFKASLGKVAEIHTPLDSYEAAADMAKFLAKL
jgi:hypothetical protein